MWCTACRQDVPGLVDGLDRRYYCPRCGEVLLSDAGIDLSSEELPSRDPSSASARNERSPETAAPDLPDFEPARPSQPQPARVTSLRWDAANWELNEKLRHVERLTSVGRRRFDAPAASGLGDAPSMHPRAESYPATYEPPAFDPAVPAFEPSPYTHPYHAPAPGGPVEPPTHAAPAWGPHEQNVGPLELLASLVSWSFLGLAVGAFACGGFLAAWGAVAERPHLQSLGMPIVLGGMVALILGLLPQSFLRRIEDERRARAAAALHDRHASAGPHFPPSRDRRTSSRPAHARY